MTRPDVDLYTSYYSRFVSPLSREIRRETYDEDFGQNGWLDGVEQDRFLEWLELSPEDRLLDVCCGSGGPMLRVARRTGCRVTGVDLEEGGIATARAAAEEAGLGERAAFQPLDASRPLPFEPATFDAITCFDAINHLPDRRAVLADWRRLLRPGGRLLFTDPIVVSGALSNEEIAVRSSIGFFLFVPEGLDDRLLEEAGFTIRGKEDRTANMAGVARRWWTAREARAAALREADGDETYAGQQRFFEVTARLAEEGRLSRLAYLAIRPE